MGTLLAASDNNVNRGTESVSGSAKRQGGTILTCDRLYRQEAACYTFPSATGVSYTEKAEPERNADSVPSNRAVDPGVSTSVATRRTQCR